MLVQQSARPFSTSLFFTVANASHQWRRRILFSPDSTLSRTLSTDLSSKPVMPRGKRKGGSQPNQPDALHYDPPNISSAGVSLPCRYPEIRQGEYHGSYDRNNRIDIYKIVDSWRSYRNDSANLQSSTVQYPPSYGPLVSDVSRNLAPLRSVHTYARYPAYRVDKPSREPDLRSWRQTIPQQAQNAVTSPSGRIPPR